jgi:hypothetical protein
MAAREKLEMLKNDYTVLLDTIKNSYVYFSECAYDLEEMNDTEAVSYGLR